MIRSRPARPAPHPRPLLQGQLKPQDQLRLQLRRQNSDRRQNLALDPANPQIGQIGQRRFPQRTDDWEVSADPRLGDLSAKSAVRLSIPSVCTATDMYGTLVVGNHTVDILPRLRQHCSYCPVGEQAQVTEGSHLVPAPKWATLTSNLSDYAVIPWTDRQIPVIAAATATCLEQQRRRFDRQCTAEGKALAGLSKKPRRDCTNGRPDTASLRPQGYVRETRPSHRTLLPIL